VNERELERWAREVGARPAERLDVEATAGAVLAGLRRQPAATRVTWIQREGLRVAAALALLLGGGAVLQRVVREPAAVRLVLEDLGDLSAEELLDVLRTLDQTLDLDVLDPSPSGLEDLTDAQLRSLLRSLES
jgi:hypothetical protein